MGNINTTVGVKTLKYGTADATPQTAVDVYQDTCTFVEKDPTITEHKSETSAKKIVDPFQQMYRCPGTHPQQSEEYRLHHHT